jgi:GNAT superfamily N-acetyltransferase
MPSLGKIRSSPVPGPLDLFASAVTAEIAELEVAEAEYVRSLGGTLRETNDGTVVRHPGLVHPAFNGALHLTSSERAFDKFIDGVESDFAAEALPFAVVTSPATLPTDAPLRLGRRGYWSAGTRVWMEVEESVPARPGDEAVSVRPTQDTARWASTVAEGVGLSAHADFVRELARLSRQAPTHRLLLATVNGEPVGGCEVTRDNQVAFVRHLGVRPQFRRRGVGHALLFRAWQAAQELKAVRLATRVIGGTGADRLYERYGFVGSHVSEAFVRAPLQFLMD